MVVLASNSQTYPSSLSFLLLSSCVHLYKRVNVVCGEGSLHLYRFCNQPPCGR
jgi:hypothetical protein